MRVLRRKTSMYMLRQAEVMRWGAGEAREQLLTNYPTLLKGKEQGSSFHISDGTDNHYQI